MIGTAGAVLLHMCNIHVSLRSAYTEPRNTHRSIIAIHIHHSTPDFYRQFSLLTSDPLTHCAGPLQIMIIHSSTDSSTSATTAQNPSQPSHTTSPSAADHTALSHPSTHTHAPSQGPDPTHLHRARKVSLAPASASDALDLEVGQAYCDHSHTAVRAYPASAPALAFRRTGTCQNRSSWAKRPAQRSACRSWYAVANAASTVPALGSDTDCPSR